MAEIWDAYDSAFHKIKGVRLIRGEPIPPNMYHLVCEIIVRHTDGTFLLMQRDFAKPCGGMWECTAGGSALSGETPLECALRELREETGVIASGLRELERIVHREYRTLFVEYLCLTSQSKDEITLQKGETIAYKWVTKDAILSMPAGALASSRALRFLRESEL